MKYARTETKTTGNVQIDKKELFKGVHISISITTNLARDMNNPIVRPLNDVACTSIVIKHIKANIPFEKQIPTILTIDINTWFASFTKKAFLCSQLLR